MITDTIPEPLICRHRWTEEEDWKALSYHRGKALRLRPMSLSLLYAAGLGLAFWSLLTRGNQLPGVVVLLLSLYGLFFRKIGTRWMHRRRFRLRPDRDALVEYRFSEEGIALAVEGLGERRSTWASVLKVLRAPDGVLIYPHERAMYWIPDQGFASREAAAELDRLLRAKVTRYESL